MWKRNAQRGIERLRIDATGALMLQFGERNAVDAYRDTHARYWYEQ